jgi:hypothetical protein
VTADAGFARLGACVVVPAHNEEATIAACLAALAAQEGVDPATYEVLLVLDACTDATESAASAAAARHPWLRVRPLHGPGEGVGVARRLGMDLAAHSLVAAGNARGLIASTDADTIVAVDWLRTQLDLVAAGSDAIAGMIELDAPGLTPGVLRRRRLRARTRMAAVRERAPDAEHHHFGGASMSVTAEAYLAVGGIEPLVALEDDAFERRLLGAGIQVRRPASVRVSTAARLRGRAPRGLAADLALDSWLEHRSYTAAEFALERLQARKRASVSVIVPAGGPGGHVPANVRELREAGVVDEVHVADATSAAGTGDAMLRGLAATSGDIVVYLDTHAGDDGPRALLGPLLCHPEVALVKAAYEGVDRATELVARPLLNLHVPELAGFVQPLAASVAARRSLLERLSLPAGEGARIAVLIDALREVGLHALGQVDLGVRRLPDPAPGVLGPVAYALLVAAGRRLGGLGVPGPYVVATGTGVQTSEVAVDERPPLSAGVAQRADDPQRARCCAKKRISSPDESGSPGSV